MLDMLVHAVLDGLLQPYIYAQELGSTTRPSASTRPLQGWPKAEAPLFLVHSDNAAMLRQ
jgi:hypothetical protein